MSGEFKMESLAVLVAILFLIAIFAGPIAIVLSSQIIRGAIDRQPGFFFRVIDFLRKALHLLFITLGTVIGVQFLILANLPLLPRVVGVGAIVTSYIALRREYFPEVFLVTPLLQKLGIRRAPQPPVFSADGQEIVRAKKTRRTGRSTGRDKHGPAGQH